MQSKTIHVLKNSRVAGLPLAVYLILLAVTIAAAAMGALPDNMLGAMLLLMVLGEGLNKIGGTLPVVRTYLGGSVVCIFGGAILAYMDLIPAAPMQLVERVVNQQGFLIF